MSIRNKLTMTIAGLLLAAAPLSAVQAAEESDGWGWSITPYIWATSFQADLNTTTPPLGTSGNFPDILSKLDGALMLHLEGQGSDFGLFSDILYVSLSGGEQHPAFSSDTSVKATLFELASVWSPGEKRYEGFEGFAGLRYMSTKFGININPTDPAFPNADLSTDDSYSDLMVGIRYIGNLSDRWGYSLRADLSTGQTDGTYNLAALLNYKMKKGAWVFGYRYFNAELPAGSKKLDLELYGPEVGYSFNF